MSIIVRLHLTIFLSGHSPVNSHGGHDGPSWSSPHSFPSQTALQEESFGPVIGIMKARISYTMFPISDVGLRSPPMERL